MLKGELWKDALVDEVLVGTEKRGKEKIVPYL